MLFSELRPTPEDCKLLYQNTELIRHFNQVAGVFNKLEQVSPALLREREEIRRLADDLKAVQGKLTRKKYLVGFIGESGIGKSTAFNNVLDDVAIKDKPALSGGGGATTAAVMRLQ